MDSYKVGHFFETQCTVVLAGLILSHKRICLARSHVLRVFSALETIDVGHTYECV